jgi:hypothetical protein
MGGPSGSQESHREYLQKGLGPRRDRQEQGVSGGDRLVRRELCDQRAAGSAAYEPPKMARVLASVRNRMLTGNWLGTDDIYMKRRRSFDAVGVGRRAAASTACPIEIVRRWRPRLENARGVMGFIQLDAPTPCHSSPSVFQRRAITCDNARRPQIAQVRHLLKTAER